MYKPSSVFSSETYLKPSCAGGFGCEGLEFLPCDSNFWLVVNKSRKLKEKNKLPDVFKDGCFNNSGGIW
jgi:hypothetical protein